jgi:hypothetical protein
MDETPEEVFEAANLIRGPEIDQDTIRRVIGELLAAVGAHVC